MVRARAAGPGRPGRLRRGRVRTPAEQEALARRLAEEVWGRHPATVLVAFATTWLRSEETDASDDDHVARWRAEMDLRYARPKDQ